MRKYVYATCIAAMIVSCVLGFKDLWERSHPPKVKEPEFTVLTENESIGFLGTMTDARIEEYRKGGYKVTKIYPKTEKPQEVLTVYARYARLGNTMITGHRITKAIDDGARVVVLPYMGSPEADGR